MVPKAEFVHVKRIDRKKLCGSKSVLYRLFDITQSCSFSLYRSCLYGSKRASPGTGWAEHCYIPHFRYITFRGCNLVFTSYTHYLQMVVMSLSFLTDCCNPTGKVMSSAMLHKTRLEPYKTRENTA